MQKTTFIASTLAALTAVAASTLWLGRPDSKALASPDPAQQTAVTAETSRVNEALTAGEKNTIAVFRQAAPSVVYITRMSRPRLSRNATAVPSGTGSGFIWDDRGHIVTNYHVVKGATAATITLADRSTYSATLVGSSAEKDIAVLRIKAPASKLKALKRGQSSGLVVGQQALAIGNPFGLDHTLSTGVVSGLGREIRAASGHPISDVIQTDAAINPGNSGGPLLDSRGRLIGINTAIFSPSGASAGIGFAVPVDAVKRIVPQLIAHGKVVRPGLGIEIASGRSARFGGVVVMSVRAGSGAQAAGLRATRRDPRSGALLLGDVIVGLGKTPIADQDDLYRALDGRKVGETVDLIVKRGGKRLTKKVKLTALSN